jgi:hypothetical protein
MAPATFFVICQAKQAVKATDVRISPFEHARLGVNLSREAPISRTLSARDVGQASSPAGGSGFQPRVGRGWFIRRASGKDARRTGRLEACPTSLPYEETCPRPPFLQRGKTWQVIGSAPLRNWDAHATD